MTAVLNTKICEVENKIPTITNLVKRRNYDAKTIEIEEKFITTSDYNKFSNDILDAKVKQKVILLIS